MSPQSWNRRDLLQVAGPLIALPVVELVLPVSIVRATPASASELLAAAALPSTVATPDRLVATRSSPLGPFFRAGAPPRAKVSPPMAPGAVLIVSGRVWSIATRRPVAGAVIELWQVGEDGTYSDGVSDFRGRTTLVTRSDGYFEFESVHPIAYQPSPGFWRSPHVHFKVMAPEHRTLVSEMFFEGDPRHDTDPMFQASLMTQVRREGHGQRWWERADFDIVLEAA